MIYLNDVINTLQKYQKKYGNIPVFTLKEEMFPETDIHITVEVMSEDWDGNKDMCVCFVRKNKDLED